jgi:hypothetical protein
MSMRTCRRCKVARPLGDFVAREKTALSGICERCRSPEETHADVAERETGWLDASALVAAVIGQAWRPAQS